MKSVINGDVISTINNFFESIKDDKDKQINICLHPAPDPDAVGCADGFAMIAKHFGFKSEIFYSGEISHPQNKTIVNLLNIDLNKVPPGEPDSNGGINVCVDCTPENSCCKEAKLVIDHHKVKPSAEFQIIKSNIGACSTIIWHIMKSLEISDTENSGAYTALLLGIRTDTNDLISENMTKDDFIAYQELLELANQETLQKVMNYPLPRYIYEKRIEVHKKGNSYEKDGIFIGGIGYISGDQRDSIAILAEEYVRMESINTSIIFAIVDKKTIQISVRSSLVSVDVNAMVKNLFGSEFGGGKPGAGGSSIPLNFYSDIEDNENDFWIKTCNHMFKKVLKDGWIKEKEVKQS